VRRLRGDWSAAVLAACALACAAWHTHSWVSAGESRTKPCFMPRSGAPGSQTCQPQSCACGAKQDWCTSCAEVKPAPAPPPQPPPPPTTSAQ
jgi:hypothetical protein